MSAVYNFRIFCETENIYTFKWDSLEPTTCPNNNSHTINLDSITVVDEVKTNSVNIIQQKNTGEFYRAESKKVIAPPGISNHDYVFPYDISVLTVGIHTQNENKDDIINVYISPNTIIGVLTQTTQENQSYIYVSQSVLDNIQRGFTISILSNGNYYNIGECLNINKIDMKIELTQNINQIFNNGSYVCLSVNNIKNFVLCNNTNYILGQKTIKSTFLPAGQIVRLEYNNTSNETHNLYFSFDYYY
jgi:hypothetical protein